MKRRAFMNWVGVSFMATSLPVAIAACSPAEETAVDADPCAADPCAADPCAAAAVDTTPREDGFAALGTVAALDSDGYLADKNFGGGQVIAVRDPADASGVVAFDSLCTHQGCTVAWESGEFACPCHGSKFGTDGAATAGPATEPLAEYETKIEDDLVLVKVA